jgi:hypothetical protein
MSFSAVESNSPAPAEPIVVRPFSGRTVVLGLLLLGIASSLAVYVFWKMHFEPFIPLQKALAAELKMMRPRVEGGRLGSAPPQLRVILHVDFPPEEGDPRIEKMSARARELIRLHQDLTGYSIVELFFVHMPKQGPPSRIREEYPAADLARGS